MFEQPVHRVLREIQFIDGRVDELLQVMLDAIDDSIGRSLHDAYEVFGDGRHTGPEK
jgi:hypothetical protein